MIDLGKVRPGASFTIPWASYTLATGASSATTNFAVGDILIYKDAGTTERASTSGYTATTTFDSLTGINIVGINTADNTTAGFFAAGSEYMVIIGPVTVDAQTVYFPLARFEIGIQGTILDTVIATLASQTSFTLEGGPAEASALLGCTVYIHDVASDAQGSLGYISAYDATTKTVTLSAAPTFTIAATDNVMIFPRTNVYSVASGAIDAAAIATGAITSAKFAAGAIDAAAIATDAIGSAELAASAITEIQAGLSTLTAAQVNSEVVDVMNVDTFAEPGQGAPAATTTLAAKINYLYKAWRNKRTQTATTQSIYADDTTTVDQKVTVSDDGTTHTKGEVATGP